MAPPLTPAACKLECFRECNNLAPGNQGYCTTQCDTYCDSLPTEKTGKGDVLRSDADSATASVKLGGSEEREAAAAGALNNGIFGDSGVSYSSGVEDLFATVFGAKRQAKNVNEADIGGFASDIGSAAKAAIGLK